jgi:uncharacterized protein YdaU (DUF1376 family)
MIQVREQGVGKLKWYKRWPEAALEGMAELSLEERGAYNTILDLMYARDGELPDQDGVLARYLRCDIRKWQGIKKALVRKRKLYVEDGLLRNARVEIELSNTRARPECGARSRTASATSLMSDIPIGIKKQSLTPGRRKKKEERKNPPTPLKGGLGSMQTQPQEESNGRQRKWSKRYTIREALGEAFEYLDRRDQKNGENGGDENSD